MSPSPAHLIRLSDLSDRELEDLLDLAGRLKRRAAAEKLQNRSVGLLFFRGSLRTRTAFESAMHQLGGHTVHLAGASDFCAAIPWSSAIITGAASCRRCGHSASRGSAHGLGSGNTAPCG